MSGIRMLKLAHALAKKNILDSMEKSAAVLEKSAEREFDILTEFYSLVREKTAEEQTQDSELALARGAVAVGEELAHTKQNTGPVVDTLQKLGTVVVLNYRLNKIAADDRQPTRVKVSAIKLGQENNHFCTELLKDLALEKTSDWGGTASKALANGTMNGKSKMENLTTGLGLTGAWGKIKGALGSDNASSSLTKSVSSAKSGASGKAGG